VGRLDPIKGFDLLLNDLANWDNDFCLKIIGSGPQEAELKKLIMTLGLSERVEMLGYREDIPQQLSKADVVLVSSLSEGGPVIALEALFYGNLLVSTAVGVVSEVLVPELLVEHGGFASKLEEVAGDYECYREVFRQLQLKYQPNFRLSNIAQQHLDLYQELVEKSVGNGG